MIVVSAVLGLLIAVFVNWASDYLPRFAVGMPAPVATAVTPPGLALPAWLRARAESPGALGLRAGVEVACILLFAALWARLGASASFAVTAAVCAFLLLVALIDLKYRLVLNVLIYPAIVAALVVRGLSGEIMTTLLGGAFAFMIFYLTSRLRPGTLGGGDVKLAALIGVAFGFPSVLWVLIVGAGSAAIIAVYLLVKTEHGIQSIPYAPFLCLGSLVALLYNPLIALSLGR